MPDLQPFAVDPGALTDYRRALAAALDAGGPAIAPYADGPAPVLDPDASLPDGLALVVSTSGSTGTPKRAMLTRDALAASADATHERLGGPGRWLLSMPAHHIAGTQVLIRSLRAGTVPLALPHFGIDEFIWAAGELTHERRYTALVPTQLRRLLDAGATARASVARFDGILLGGAAADPGLLSEAADAGATVLTTYGSSETAGGCVYSGVPLTGTTVELADDGRITLCGTTIASGYLGAPELTDAVFGRRDDGTRTFRTDDLGVWRNGRLHVIGRIDDLINTGGVKVAPRVIESAAALHPQVLEAVALGLPDREWGEAVALAIRARTALSLHDIREHLRDHVPSYALPKRLLLVDEMPLRGPGKPDRAALAKAQGWQTLTAHQSAD
ncbi:MAG TPA: o-succinylbenzoate--CoA ligase [Flexivirga sp.]|uniref:o-succinylbenzoate--CoA ligase n=1 Tax=Flexivirga sp. TaxID=1962927 RepID=UPI002C871CF8|nr:o-succinylbenzoate--CoA ligase [Flexivirga sp.]HWC22342.1 o-succinylbenzoate--CoA ligase [Flexivirga sp.]